MNAKRSPKERAKLGDASPGEKNKKSKKDLPNFSDPDALVTFIVGAEPNTKNFVVHKEFACHRSPVLNAAFNSEFVEGRTQTYRLDDVSKGAFRYFVQYLYSEKLVVKQLADNWNFKDENGLGDVEDLHLVELWVLGDKFCVPNLQNLVIKTLRLIHRMCDQVPIATFKKIYESTPADSKLRQYAIQITAALIPSKTLKRRPECFPHEMLADLAAFMMGIKGTTFNYGDFYVPVVED